MGIKAFNPVTPGQRFKAINNFSELTTDTPHKSLTEALRKQGGRNNTGRMTSRRRGGGHKRRYRIIDFRRDKTGVATVLTLEYDPNRSAHIALVEYTDNEKRYILAPQGLQVGAKIETGQNLEPQVGNSMPINQIPAGTFIHNIELTPGRGGQMARAAGSYAVIMANDQTMAHLKMPSGEVRLVPATCVATVGQVGNIEHENESWGKAGRSRWFGWRPASRAVAKNPVDHPMGGGEGKSSGGRHPCSRSGIPAKGYQTRTKSKNTNKYIIQKRRKRVS